METADAELGRLISKRAAQDRRSDPDELEPYYMESVRRYNARREEELRAAWAAFHEGQAASLRQTLEDLVSHHETQAERYRDQPKGAANA